LVDFNFLFKYVVVNKSSENEMMLRDEEIVDFQPILILVYSVCFLKIEICLL